MADRDANTDEVLNPDLEGWTEVKPSESAVEETVAEPSTVQVRLVEDYEGPTPVYVSVPESLDREELTAEGVDLPSDVADQVAALPYAEVVVEEEAD